MDQQPRDSRTRHLRSRAPSMFQHKEVGGGFLSDDPHCQSLVKRLVSSDPRLGQRSEKNVIRQAQSASPLLWERAEFSDHLTFREWLRSSSPSPDGRRIIIVEGQPPVYIDAMVVHFGMHPAFFSNHERVRAPDVELPSIVKEHFRVFCAESGRPVGATRVLGEFTDTGILQRKCSVWRRQRPGEGGGWDCIIITDPPLRFVSVGMSGAALERIRLPTWRPYRGGYIDPTPHQSQVKAGCGPPRTCMLDDLHFYIEKHAGLFEPHGSNMGLFLAQKIVASHYQKHVGLIHEQISQVQHSMSRQETLIIFNPEVVEKQWSDVRGYERRVSHYCLEVESIMFQCGIPFSEPDTSKTGNWHSIENDFRFVFMMLKYAQWRVESLSSSITGLASITLTRQEAASMKALTIVGLVFLPLSFTASLFAMPAPYGPGSEGFGIYFACAIPLSAVAFATYFLFGGSWAQCHGWGFKKAPV
ncbi:hypothetical protein B0H67DRAFT_598002 [Lasiosphaeris hirsuta]|uniref:Uncharacterized protein n=1 Tax=Lasiosphaeris hirsuta TaxID=260670 RepID=A0AA40AYJ7_9PEZI|nr:hypothetical protein B0H67DRAFT_598002 [Lasiosphaeris hirsuta]